MASTCSSCERGTPDGYGMVECQLGWEAHDNLWHQHFNKWEPMQMGHGELLLPLLSPGHRCMANDGTGYLPQEGRMTTIEEQARMMLSPVLGECVRQRTELGIAKYGQRLDHNFQPQRAKAIHLVQEELDALQYALWMQDYRKARRHAAEAEITLAQHNLTLEEIMEGGKK